jgi:hypothetical protein
MIGPMGGFQGGMNLTININSGAGGMSPLGGGAGSLGGGCCACGGPSDGFSPSSELSHGNALGGFSAFGGGSNMADFAALLGGGSSGLGTPHPGFNFGDTAHPWAGGIGGPGLPLDLLSGGGGGLPPLGGGSLANQALMMQAASSDMNQAALIGAQTGAMGGLAGAQGTALAGINPLMSGLMSNYG